MSTPPDDMESERLKVDVEQARLRVDAARKALLTAGTTGSGAPTVALKQLHDDAVNELRAKREALDKYREGKA